MIGERTPEFEVGIQEGRRLALEQVVALALNSELNSGNAA
jgi:hypothetical protein